MLLVLFLLAYGVLLLLLLPYCLPFSIETWQVEFPGLGERRGDSEGFRGSPYPACEHETGDGRA